MLKGVKVVLPIRVLDFLMKLQILRGITAQIGPWRSIGQPFVQLVLDGLSDVVSALEFKQLHLDHFNFSGILFGFCIRGMDRLLAYLYRFWNRLDGDGLLWLRSRLSNRCLFLFCCRFFYRGWLTTWLFLF